MAEAHVVKGVMIPFLSALTYMHAQVQRARTGEWGQHCMPASQAC